MWLSGEQYPDFRTINDFRGVRMKEVTQTIFAEVLVWLVEAGYVKLEAYFADGTKIEANANKHKVVWDKRKETYQKRVREKVDQLMQAIEAENEAEQAEYGEKDLEERGGSGGGPMNAEQLEQKIAEINQKLNEQNRPKEETKATRAALKTLSEDCLPRLEKYEEQTKVLDGRNSYSKTDPDASCMQMKEDRGAEKTWPKPAYNVQLGTEGQFVVGYSVHNRAGDPACLIPHLEQVRHNLGGQLPRKIVADAAYGSEENYAYLEKHQAENFLKYNTFYQDTHNYRDPEVLRAHQFRAENFRYDPGTDQFICPADKRLHFQSTTRYTTDNGYETQRRIYACKDCAGCPLRSRCTKAKDNRSIRISFQLLEYRKQARANLTSAEGERLRSARSTEVETVFGHIKHNLGFRRFHLRGLEKVNTEWGLVSIAHNMQKLAV
jgi:predicted RNA-binding protein with PIN domain